MGYHVNPHMNCCTGCFYIHLYQSGTNLFFNPKSSTSQLEAISTTGLASTTSLHAFWIECNNIGKSPKLKQQTSYSCSLVLLVYIYIVLFGYMDISFGGGNFSTKMPHPSYLHQVWLPRKCHLHLHRVHGGYDHYLSTSGILRKQALETKTPEFFACFNQPLPECDWQKNAVFSKVRDVRYNGIQWLY